MGLKSTHRQPLKDRVGGLTSRLDPIKGCPALGEAPCATSSPPLVLYHVYTITARRQSSATVTPLSRRRPSSGERPLGTGASPYPFPLSHGEPPCTGVAARPNSGEPWPLAPVESMIDSWIGHPLCSRQPMDSVHVDFPFKNNFKARKSLPLSKEPPASL
jgi:hypothetical protein